MLFNEIARDAGNEFKMLSRFVRKRRVAWQMSWDAKRNATRRTMPAGCKTNG